MEGIALKPLTVDFHEPGFVGTLNGENQQPFRFQMSDEQRQKAGTPWGPANPQALNRYSYVLSNPLRWADPSGHWTLSVGLSFRGGLAGGGTYSTGLIVDGHGNWRIFDTSGGGLTIGAIVAGGVQIAVTAADHVEQTAGSAFQEGMDGAYLGKFSVDFINPSQTSWDVGKYPGIAIGFGGGVGLDAHFEMTDTQLRPVFTAPPKGRDPCITKPGYCGDTGVPAKPTGTPTPRRSR
jgi:hypothetical protein